MAVSKPDSSPTFCFLSVTWGYIADTDIESEKFRGLGSLRFDIYGALRLLLFRKYGGRIHFLPTVLGKDYKQDSLISEDDSDTSVYNRNLSPTSNTEKNKVSPLSITPSLIVSDKEKIIKAITHNPSPLSIDQTPSNSFRQKTSKKYPGGNMYSTEGNNKDSPFSFLEDILVTKSISLPVDSSKLPPEWKSVSGPFSSVNVVNSPWLSKSFMASEKAAINDGLIDLIYTQDIPRLDILPYILGSTKGGYLNKNGLFHFKTKAIIIEPDGTRYISSKDINKNKGSEDDSAIKNQDEFKGLYSFDGERADISPVKIEALPNLLNVIVSPLMNDSEKRKDKNETFNIGLKPNVLNSVVSRSASFVSFF
ncbi:Sphingosine kinase 1 [Smittium mucronatum]|uniref:Sphingosine kinase 1 n=1 Tax=Smittium mucronatum TaxID=133383 RepID=A0A1R0GV41_9FUNG|nr:Sphingosine kinase 1 [Smittium mucronatum]